MITKISGCDTIIGLQKFPWMDTQGDISANQGL